MSARVAVIAGANVGLGSALAASLVGAGDSVVALGRANAVAAVAAEVPKVRAITTDVTDASAVDRAFGEIESTVGPASIVVYNAHRIELAASADTSIGAFEDAWRVGCFGAFVVAKRALPKMLERAGGTVIFTGATGSTRGGARTVAFASAKFGLRAIAQSFARELGPLGIHVVHVIIDGLVWSERSRTRFAAVEAKSMSPRAIATTYRALIDQDRSAWTHELDLRPWSEKF